MPQNNLYYIVTGFIVGILFPCVFTNFICEFVFQVLIFGTSCVLLMYPAIFTQFAYNVQKKSIYPPLLGLLFFGISLGMFRVSLWQYFNHPGVLHSFDGQKVEVHGLVMEEPSTSASSQKIVVTVDSVKQSQKTVTIPQERLVATVNRYEKIQYGDEVSLVGSLKSPQPITDNSGTFAYDTYLARQGIFMTMVLPQVKVLSEHNGSRLTEFLYSVKQWFIDQSVRTLPYPESGLFTGLVISGRSGLSKDDQALFTRVGIVHIVALSGTNVTIIVEALMLVLFFVPKRLRLGIGACGIIAFTIMTGAEPTVVRAAIMGLLLITATALERTYDIGRALFIAAGGMLLWDPMIIFNLSFELSFIATFALIFVVPLVMGRYQKIVQKISEKFGMREIVVSSLIIELFLLPLILNAIGNTSVIAVVSNVLVLPILPLAMLTGFTAVMVGVLHYVLALPFITLAYLSLGYILFIAHTLGALPFAMITISISTWMMCAMYLGLGIWYWWMKKKVKNK